MGLNMEFTGQVIIEEQDEDGNYLQQATFNKITYALRNQIINFLGNVTALPPTHMAVGVSESSLEGVATTATSTSLTDTTKSWITNAYQSFSVTIVLGTGTGQTRSITSNTATVLTTSPAWTTTPDTTSRYRITESLDVRTLTSIPREIERLTIATSKIGSDNMTAVTVFRKTEAGGEWSHGMLTSAAALKVVVHECDNATDWDAPGTGSAISLDATTRQEGAGSMRIDISGTGAETTDFRNDNISVDGTLVSEATGILTFWYFISDASILTADPVVELSSSTSDDTNEFQWTVTKETINDGWNYIWLPLNTATHNGTPLLSNIVRIKVSSVYAANSDGEILRLDRVWLFEDAGTPLAIVEFQPTQFKGTSSVITVRWKIIMNFSAAANSMLWNAQNLTTAVVADVTVALTETGSGSFIDVSADPHPWRWTNTYVPAASGYVTIGGNSLDTKNGNVALWAKYHTSAPANNSILFDWRFDSSNRITLARKSDGTGWILEYVKAGTTKSVSVTDAHVSGEYRFIAAGWDGQSLYLSSSDPDNATATTLTTTTMTIADLMESLSTSDATVTGGSGLTSTNTRFGPILFFTDALSDTEVDTLFNLDRAYFYKES